MRDSVSLYALRSVCLYVCSSLSVDLLISPPLFINLPSSPYSWLATSLYLFVYASPSLSISATSSSFFFSLLFSFSLICAIFTAVGRLNYVGRIVDIS